VSPTVLLIDDDPDFLDEAADSVQFAGWGVLAAKDAMPAVLPEALVGVMLDLELTTTNGFVLLEELARRRPDVDVMLVSGHESDLLRSAVGFALDLGFVNVTSATKPLTTEIIVSWLRGLRQQPKAVPASAPAAASGRPPPASTVRCDPEQLVAVYQPQFRLGDLRCTGAEVLARYPDETHGLLTPNHFLPALLNAGLGHRLFEVMLRQACTMLETLSAANITDLVISVNLSPDLFREHADWLLAHLADARFPRANLMLEVPESLASRADPRDIRLMAALRLAGYRLSIDDFGCEYANVDRLLSFPVSEVKVDRSILERAVRSPSGAVFLRGLAQMCSSLGLHVVFEGVSSVEMLQMTTGLEPASVQGNLLSKPLSGAAFCSLLLESAGSD